jgi:ABC-type oligopeptide transport system substrate-binding subunit
MKNILTFVVLAVAFVVSIGCDTGSSSYTPPPSSQVKSQSEVDFLVDHMADQGADRAEARAFVETLNQLQKEHEAGY